MRLVSFGILAVSLSLCCAGCAMQAGDPDPADEVPSETASPDQKAPAQAPTTKTATPGSGLHTPSSTPTTPVEYGSPDPSPWNPPKIPAVSGNGNGSGNGN